MIPSVLALGEVKLTEGLADGRIDRVCLATKCLDGLHRLRVVVIVAFVQDHLLVAVQDGARDDLAFGEEAERCKEGKRC